MAVTRDFIVKLIADPKDLLKGFNDIRNKAGESFGAANTKLQELVPSFQKIQAASAVAFAGLTAAAGVAIKAAVDAQAEQNRLRQILLTTGGATEQQVKALIEQANALEKVGVASAGNIITAQSQLATFDLQFETIQRLTPAITDYVIAEKGATASAEDFKSMTNALAQALQGNFAALTKSGFVLDETTKELIKNGTEAERSAALVDVLNSTYRGFNESARETAEGRMVALRNSFNALREAIGMALLPAFEGMLKILQRFADFLVDNASLITGVGVALGVFTGIIVAASVALKLYATIAAIATAANTAFGVSLSATGIGAIIVLIGLLVAGFVQLMIHSEGARNVMRGLFNLIIAGVEMTVNAFIMLANSFIQVNNIINSGLKFIGINLGQVGYLSEVNFGRLGSSAAAAGDAVVVVNGHLAELQRLLPTTSNLVPTLLTVAGAQEAVATATAKVDALRQKAKSGGIDAGSLADALKEQSDAQKVLNDLLGETARKTGGVSSANKEAKSRIEQYTSVLKAAQGQSDNYERSVRRLRDAKKGLERADADLLAAQEALTKAQQAGSPEEILDAERALAAAERQVTRGKFAGEQAAFAVADAERRLAEIRANGESSAQDIRKAEIDLEEAKLRVVDTEDDQIKTSKSLDEARRQLRIATQGLMEGDKELVVLKKNVTSAEEAQIRAAEQYRDALKEQKAAADEYRKALAELAKAIENFPKIAQRIGQGDLIPIDGVQDPSLNGYGTFRNPKMDEPTVVVNVTAGIGGNAYQVGKEIIEVLDQYTSVAGPLDTLMRVA